MVTKSLNTHINKIRNLKKHIETSTSDSSSFAQRQQEDALLLANIYYLSGYIVECSVYFRFFEENKDHTTIAGFANHIENYNDGTICFKRGTRYRLGGHFQFPVDSSTGDPKDSFLSSEKVLDALNAISSTRLNGTILTDFMTGATKSNVYQKKWEPALRYEIPFSILKQDVFEYFKNAYKIYNQLTA